MRIPNIDCKIEMFSNVNPSEDEEKVRISILNIFPYSNFTSKKSSLKAESTDISSLEKIYEVIHSKQSQKAYKRNLENNLDSNSTWFYLNKQAAFVNKIVICDELDESPLGPIRVVLTSKQIDRLIEWLIS